MTTFQNVQMKLAGSRPGRLTLHFLCVCQDRKFRWHARGIVRELRATVAPLKRLLVSLHGPVQRATNLAATTRAVDLIHDTVLLKKSLNRLA